MNNLIWYYPKTKSECIKYFNDGFRPHGGGTFLVKTSLNIKGLFNLSDIDEFKILSNDGNHFNIGSAITFSDAGSWLNLVSPDNYLSKALLNAASTPLRNRITIGGSLCSLPKWSDIAAPLLCANAIIQTAESDKEISLEEYFYDRKIRKNTLVSSIKIPVSNLNGTYYRFTLTGFDYQIFSVAVSESNSILRCAVNGNKNGPSLFTGTSTEILNETEQKLIFSPERGFSSEYIKNRALTEIKKLVKIAGA
ncbi:MAG: FAD binding domain-containing protein [Spirochaetales bacterium]|nr:FAD binding domain-containing protein [Spirochaetales bacterium]